MNLIGIFNRRLTSFQIIILGFAAVILLGALILMLPISSRSGEMTGFMDSLFTSTSAVCVTGLVVKDTASYWSFFGQVIILILIQIGGIGVITMASVVSLLAGKKISLMQRQTIQNALSTPQVGGSVRLIRFVIKATAMIETAGAVLLLPVFVKRFGTVGIWYAVFHSVSAFCNAGFDLMGRYTGSFSSLCAFSGNLYLSIVICALIVAGGLGFLAWEDIAAYKLKIHKYRMQTKVIIASTAILILVPTILFFFIDFSHMHLVRRFSCSLFQAVTPRTAGFNTVDFSRMTDPGRVMIMLLMLVGGSPSSTAGGMKTTTVAVLTANAFAIFRRRKNAKLFGRRVDDEVVKQASTVLFMYVTLFLSGALIISLIENQPFEKCAFEAISAIATVGLSLGLTPGLGVVSHIILMLLMFFGRVGGFTVVYAALSYREGSELKYPLGNITVG